MLEKALQCVERFMEKHDLIPEPVPFEYATISSRLHEMLLAKASVFEELAKVNTRPQTRVAMMRLSLIMEEVGELAQALQAGNELAAVDAITDLLYVTLGTAIAYGWDLNIAFDEVHASNMSKARRGEDDPRLRNKGETFVEPCLTRALAPPKCCGCNHWRRGCNSSTPAIELADGQCSENTERKSR